MTTMIEISMVFEIHGDASATLATRAIDASIRSATSCALAAAPARACAVQAASACTVGPLKTAAKATAVGAMKARRRLIGSCVVESWSAARAKTNLHAAGALRSAQATYATETARRSGVRVSVIKTVKGFTVALMGAQKTSASSADAPVRATSGPTSGNAAKAPPQRGGALETTGPPRRASALGLPTESAPERPSSDSRRSRHMTRRAGGRARLSRTNVCPQFYTLSLRRTWRRHLY
ncbi:hypothetical protein M885DRAFT_521219 [Pelagophyceae sp. CCMP2097]|nr:hypothetical protein M885DRAFT_521219 [Pelagophyceae sp. CCMP2097]